MYKLVIARVFIFWKCFWSIEEIKVQGIFIWHYCYINNKYEYKLRHKFDVKPHKITY